MTMQARFSENDPRLYSPSRDIAYNFPKVAKVVAQRLENREHWPAFTAYLKAFDVQTDPDLGDACKSMIEFILKPEEGEEMHETLDRVGWHDLTPESQFAISAQIGAVMMGMYWAGVREATLDGKGPFDLLDENDLQQHGERAAFLLTAPRYLRWLWRMRYNWLKLRKK